mmetsp:Transcript_109295/g.304671  ORF Transcript_109295/g.304671 Transcript_109295/m.304671 type:complete len:220 (+) Transcript_109295:372-1031(+)
MPRNAAGAREQRRCCIEHLFQAEVGLVTYIKENAHSRCDVTEVGGLCVAVRGPGVVHDVEFHGGVLAVHGVLTGGMYVELRRVINVSIDARYAAKLANYLKGVAVVQHRAVGQRAIGNFELGMGPCDHGPCLQVDGRLPAADVADRIVWRLRLALTPQLRRLVVVGRGVEATARGAARRGLEVHIVEATVVQEDVCATLPVALTQASDCDYVARGESVL